MPIYEYQCQSCDHQFEALQKISESPLTDCPECSATTLKKMVSAAAFKLKGSGWYETDFKNSGAAPKSKAPDNAATSSSSTSSGGSGSSGDSAAKTKQSTAGTKSVAE